MSAHRLWIALALAGIGLVVGAFEALWRLEHVTLQPPTPSPDGHLVAEVRSLPEGSILPYATGVFIRPHWLPLLGLGATAVFGGYCERLQLAWLADDRLAVHCDGDEARPTRLRATAWGAVIDIDGNATATDAHP